MLERLGKQSRSAAQEAAQTQAVLNEKNSTEKFTRVIRRTQLRALRRDSSQSDVHEMLDVSQTQCKDAKRSERHSTIESGAKCKDKTPEKES